MSVLAVLVRSELSLALVQASSSGGLSLGGEVFQEMSSGAFMGFHDWLREESTGRVVGLIWHPHEPRWLDLDPFRDSANCSIEASGQLVIRFDGHPTGAEQSGGEQSFAYNRLLVSEDGCPCLLVDVEALTAEEQASLFREFRLLEAGCQTRPV